MWYGCRGKTLLTFGKIAMAQPSKYAVNNILQRLNPATPSVNGSRPSTNEEGCFRSRDLNVWACDCYVFKILVT
jgi:hypothetical protein